jgi:hypothetical protein
MDNWIPWIDEIKNNKFYAVGLLVLLTLPVTLLLVFRSQDTRTSAALPDALEAESGVTSSTGVTKVSDSQASGGQYVKFAKSTTGPTPTNPPSSSGEIYGSGIAMEALNNTRIGTQYGYKSSIRFRANESSTLNSFKVYVIWSTSRTGYHDGDGGTLKFELQTDDGTSNHFPSGNVLASVIHNDPLSKGFWPVINFSNPPTLIKGQIYHLVTTNIHPDPVNNYVSLDHTFVYNATNPMQPRFNDLDWAELQAWSGAEWRVRRENTPILQLNYGNGGIQGHGIMEIGSVYKIGGSNSIRQRITPSENVTFSEISVRVRRTSGSSPLTASINGATINLPDSTSIPASPAIRASTGSQWVTAKLPNQMTLTAGQTYFLTLSTDSGTEYSMDGLRQGSNQGFNGATFFDDGYAESNSGSSWSGFSTPWGTNPTTLYDLQFYFK